MQCMLASDSGRESVLPLPAPDEEVLPGKPWGRFDALFTPAYWRGQAWQHEQLGTYAPGPLGRDLAEEVAVCILGGYGNPAELGLAAFDHLRQRGLLRGLPTQVDLELALSDPLPVHGRMRRYRFCKSKARALANAFRGLSRIAPDLPDRALRDALVVLPGVGLKTASWVVRNHRMSDEIAIVDVHIARAGRIAGFIEPNWNPARHYLAMENAFLRFAMAIEVRASVLDGLMWDHMRRLAPIAREADVPAVKGVYGRERTVRLQGCQELLFHKA